MEESRRDRTRLILASASPRRRELMELLGRPFTPVAADVPEEVPAHMAIDDTPGYLARLKAESVFNSLRHEGEALTVIGSDTVVRLGDRIYGKPRDSEDACRMLGDLSGRVHTVITGVTIISDAVGTPGSAPFSVDFTSSTEVEFYELSGSEILKYVATGEPMDKAGAYGVQGYGALLVKSINGDFYTVMGFPIARVARMLDLYGL